MDPENAGMKTEYSPLNNMSSSGEDVEQFSLPVTPAPQSRPKRRRKRKEFDSITSHAKFVNSFKKGQGCPTCAGFFTTALLIILIASVCGLSVVIYYMSNNVEKMQKLIDNLQVAKGTTFSSLLTLQGKSDEMDNQLQQLEILSQNFTKRLNLHEESIVSLNRDIKNTRTTKKPSSAPEIGVGSEIQKQLAQFGSDILALKGDVAKLHQEQLSFHHRLADLDESFRSFLSSDSNGQHGVSTNTPPTGPNQMSELQASIFSVNDSCTSSVSTMKVLVQNISGNVDLYKAATSNKIKKIGIQVAGLQNYTKDLSKLNETIDTLISRLEFVEHNQSESDSHSDRAVADLSGRVDEQERYVMELRGQLTSQLTHSLENQVVNLTLSSAMEDIISRVIDMKIDPVQSALREGAADIDALKTRILALETNITSMVVQIGKLTGTVSRTLVTDNLVTAITPVSPQTTTQLLSELGNRPSDDKTNFAMTPMPPTMAGRAVHVDSTQVNVSSADLKSMLGQREISTTGSKPLEDIPTL